MGKCEPKPKPVIERFMSHVSPEPNSGCWLWAGSVNNSGYGMFCREQGKAGSAHRISYEIFCEPIPEGLHILHRCDNRVCVNPEHLFFGTNQDNIADMVQKGRQRVLKGEEIGNSKLTEKQVREIFAQRGQKPQRAIAVEYGVARQTIKDILKGKTWKHITNPSQPTWL